MAGLSSLESLLGINNTAGNSQIQDAINALQSVNVPNLASLTLPELQKYVSAGVLTPAQYQAIQENPDVYNQTIQATQDNTGKNAQSAALAQLGNIVANGGSTPINQANLQNNINQTNQAMQAARQGIQEQAQQQGVANGGLNFISQLLNEQGNAQNANNGAVQAGANNAQLALQALANQGTLGGTMQGQANQMSQAQAQAAQQIAQYNSQLQSQANQYNTQNVNNAQATNLANAQGISNANVGNENNRTMYNAQLPQQIFNDQLGKAGAMANEYNTSSNLAQNQAANQNNFIGSLLGTGAQLGAAYGTGGASLAADPIMKGTFQNTPEAAGQNSDQYAPPGTQASNNYYGFAHGGMVPCYAKGGEVHDHAICMQVGGPVPGNDAPIPGDSPMNDTVDAKLSPGEIVLPRSVAQAPNAPQLASQFVQSQGQMGQGINSFADILAKLEENGLELRLAAKGA